MLFLSILSRTLGINKNLFSITSTRIECQWTISAKRTRKRSKLIDIDEKLQNLNFRNYADYREIDQAQHPIVEIQYIGNAHK
ncbi:hypothetical protein VTH8203_04104 [Vibrio thalassae]|uniref:Uncharacterized protein n=1 Tax=Vibrio thalassae TaxID=1243014 RepID=A0A240EP84_9VIBR|nr:hypothetical protein VTH8203_04104 [Vibrio thalassae]